MLRVSKTVRAGLLSLCLGVSVTGCASVDGFFSYFKPAKIQWNDTKWCVPLRLKTALRLVSQKYGAVSVHSSHRWPAENRRKGGKPKSYHLRCSAVDFSVADDPDGVTQYLISLPQVGGYSRYPQGFYHIDKGPRRTW